MAPSRLLPLQVVLHLVKLFVVLLGWTIPGMEGKIFRGLLMTLRSLAKKLFRKPKSPSPLPVVGPFAMSDTNQRPKHRPMLLSLPTSDGSGQTVHPDVVYISAGFGRQNWRYWMVVNPYPYGNSRFENPEVLASHDGVAFQEPRSGLNPLVPAPADVRDFHSDPCLVWREPVLYLYFRQTIRSGPVETNVIFRMETIDGEAWSPAVRVLEESVGSGLLSPSIRIVRGQWRLWSVEKLEGRRRLCLRTSSDGLTWSDAQMLTLEACPEGGQPWHCAVEITDDEVFHMLLTTSTADGGKGARLHYANSSDGVHWIVRNALFQPSFAFEATLQYRASMVAEELSGQFLVWYSACSSARVWSTAFIRMSLDQGLLVDKY